MEYAVTAGAGASANAHVAPGVVEAFTAPRFTYAVECRTPGGDLVWRESISNLVTTAGKNDLLTQYFKGAGYTASWSVGLIDNAGFTVVAVTDTAASHPGWAEWTAYSAGTRPALVLGAAANGSINNGASTASFTMTGNGSVNGAFVATSSAKGGTGGVLYSAGSFAQPNPVLAGYILAVTMTLSC